MPTRVPITPTDSGKCLNRSDNGVWDGENRPLAALADPIEPQDAATRAYVDSATAAIVAYWRYDTNVNMVDPTSGRLRLNQAAPGGVHLATQIALSLTTNMGVSVATEVGELLSGDVLEIQMQSDLAQWARFALTDTPTLSGGWALLVVSAVEYGNTIWRDNESVAIRAIATAAATRAMVRELAARLEK